MLCLRFLLAQKHTATIDYADVVCRVKGSLFFTRYACECNRLLNSLIIFDGNYISLLLRMTRTPALMFAPSDAAATFIQRITKSSSFFIVIKCLLLRKRLPQKMVQRVDVASYFCIWLRIISIKHINPSERSK